MTTRQAIKETLQFIASISLLSIFAFAAGCIVVFVWNLVEALLPISWSVVLP